MGSSQLVDSAAGEGRSGLNRLNGNAAELTDALAIRRNANYTQQ